MPAAENAPKLRILVVGEFWARQYEESLVRALTDLGCTADGFSTHPYLGGAGPLARLERRFHEGPRSWAMRRALLAKARSFRPHVILFRRPLEFSAKFLTRIQQSTGAVLAHYQNDDPFGPRADPTLWERFRKSIPRYDLHFVFREVNIEEFRAAGARDIEVLLPYYVEDFHHPPVWRHGERARFEADVVFIGHGEDDLRADVFDAMLAAGFDLRLHGSGFEGPASGRPHARLLPTRYLDLAAYPGALEAARVALAFYSGVNRDVLTTRVFEIPACGGLLLAHRNPTVVRYFVEDREALFFSDPEEAVQQVRRVLADPGWAASVAKAGRQRVLAEGHEVHDRARQLLAAFRRHVAQGAET